MLRQWLNGEFAETVFTPEELTNIPSVTVDYPSFYTTLHTCYPTTKQVADRIFLLSKEEVEQYLTDKNDRLALLTDHARSQLKNPCPLRSDGSWWLRTTVHSGCGAHAQYIYNYGQLMGSSILETGAGVWETDVGVRPAMWYQP